MQDGERMVCNPLHCFHLAVEPSQLVFGGFYLDGDNFRTVDRHHIDAVSAERCVDFVDDASVRAMLAQECNNGITNFSFGGER